MSPLPEAARTTAHRARKADVRSAGSRTVAALLDAALRSYQLLVSPLLGPHCRFAPSCSEYARIAISLHGPLRGLGLAARRVARCHPFHPGGIDLVPEPFNRRPGAADASPPRALAGGPTAARRRD